jgi:hypothetical protein
MGGEMSWFALVARLRVSHLLFVGIPEMFLALAKEDAYG